MDLFGGQTSEQDLSIEVIRKQHCENMGEKFKLS